MKITSLKLGLLVAFLVLYQGCGSKKSDSGSSSSDDDPEETTEEETTDDETSTPDGVSSSGQAFDWQTVSFKFVSPADTEDLADPSVVVEIETNLASGGTWSLYYGTSFNSVEGASPIVENQAISNLKATWDTSAVDPGTYFLFVSLNYEGSSNIRYLQGAITIDDEGADNMTPFMSFTGNVREQVFIPGTDTIDVDFIASDADGDELTMKIQISDDDGATWTDILTGLTKDSPELTKPDAENQPSLYRYTYTIPGGMAQSARYRIRVAGLDPGGREGELITEVFGMAPVVPTYLNSVRQVLVNNCTGCHGSFDVGTMTATPGTDTNAENQNIWWTSFDRVFYTSGGNQANRDGTADEDDDLYNRIRRESTAVGVMPPGGNMPQADRDILEMWDWTNRNSGADGPDIQNLRAVRADASTVNLQANSTISRATLTDPDILPITFEARDADSAVADIFIAVYFEAEGQNNEAEIIPVNNTFCTGAANVNKNCSINIDITAWNNTGTDKRIRIVAYDDQYRIQNRESQNITLTP